MELRQTHTYAELEVSKAAYDEIAVLLRRAGYNHVFMEDGTIDMHGIGLTRPVTDVDRAARKTDVVATLTGDEAKTIQIPDEK
jgi:hypothetical protein